MELNHLRYFYEVAKAGSFSSAARLLRVSQPSLSKTVALLEAREQVKLLERSKKGVALTRLGKEVYTQCEKIFGSVAELENLCRGTQTLCEGPLRIGASDHIANYLLVEKIALMSHKYERVVPSVFVGAPQEIIQMIQKREIEFGLFFTKVKAAQISYRSLMQIPLVAVCSPKLKFSSATAGKKPTPKYYIGSIVQEYKQYPAQDVLDSLGSNPEIHFQSNSQELQKRLCLEGLGWALLARFMVERELKQKTLIELKLPRAASTQLLLATREKHSLSLNARSFLEVMGVNL